MSLFLTVKSFSPVHLSALFLLLFFSFSIWTDGALFLPFAAWHRIIIPVQAALSLHSERECGLLYIALRRDYTAVSAPVCRIGLLLLQGSCSRLPLEVSNSPYHFPDDALGRINSGGGRMLFTCRFLLSHLRQTTPAPPLPLPFQPKYGQDVGATQTLQSVWPAVLQPG